MSKKQILKAESSFQKRFDGIIDSIKEKYRVLYGPNEEMLINLIQIAKEAFRERKKELKIRDLERETNHDWFLSNDVTAISLYVNLFSNDLKNFENKIPYLKELGINLIHFMPLFKTRVGEDDGGFAISNYTQINPKLGMMEDFEKLNDVLRSEGISTCVDFIANHTAKEHEWALRAKAGEKEYQDMYYMYDTYDIPFEFEKHLPNIFPELAPGNFTYQGDIKKWVFTTFYDFQWDLNYKNPLTLNNVIKNLFFLLNRGVDFIRIDAIRHIWKETGTDCSNLPQVHLIVSIMKTIVNIVCPGVIFLGEAITSQQSVLEYFGVKQSGCELMYNVTLMTALWNSLATKDTRYMRLCMQNSPVPPKGSCWFNYIRCHDDIEFVIEENEIDFINLDPFWHKQFLIDFYRGNISKSFSVGELYSYDKKTKNARISGTLASLCGLEKGINKQDKQQIDYAHRRILLLYSVLFAYSGIPMIYSGDEVATLNDYTYKKNPEKMFDSRWIHRTKFDWHKANLRNAPTTSENVVFQGVKQLIAIRKKEPIFHSSLPIVIFDTKNDGIFGCFKKNDNEIFLLLANFTEYYQTIEVNQFKNMILDGAFIDLIRDKKMFLNSTHVSLDPYEFLWLKQ